MEQRDINKDINSVRAIVRRAFSLREDKAENDEIRDRLLPEIIARTRSLREAHQAQWERNRKRFGWETLARRYGAALGRLEDVRDLLDRYLRGNLPVIEELEAEPLPLSRWQNYRRLASPSVIV